MPDSPLPAEDPVKVDLRKTSDRFGNFVSVVFGLVIGQALTKYQALVLDPWVSWFQSFALLGVVMTTILSWIGYVTSMYLYPYDMKRPVSWARMATDFAIVSLYARMLFSLEKLVFLDGSPAPDLSSYLLGYLLIFLGYIASGQIRIWEWQDGKATQRAGLILSALFYGLLLILYEGFDPGSNLVAWGVMLVCPVWSVCYRIWRHRQYLRQPELRPAAAPL